MTDFGDITDDDVSDPTPPDPLAICRKIVELERALSGDNSRPSKFEELHPNEQALRLFVMVAIIEKLKREWSH